MTDYHVVWVPAAWKRLRFLWEKSANADNVDRAREMIEHALGTDPHRLGTPLSEGLWKYSYPPLLVFFSIDSPKMRVVISNVYEIP